MGRLSEKKTFVDEVYDDKADTEKIHKEFKKVKSTFTIINCVVKIIYIHFV